MPEDGQITINPIDESVVRAFARGAMDRRIDPPWWTHRGISRSS